MMGYRSNDRPRYLHRLAARLSLFAMLLIFVGPLISQAVIATPMSPGMAMDMPGMDMSHGMDGSASAATTASKPALGADVLWAKCGYCVLLFQCPAVASTPTFPSAAAPLPPVFGVAALRAGHARLATFPGARSRAPPPFA